MHPKHEPKLGWRDMLAMVAILYQLILMPVMLVLGGVSLALLLIDFHLR